MAQFNSPSHGSSLAISTSPLGLIELSDEEFEVHGPRLNRYALNWAFYLGHHWSQRREQEGDPLSTYNYARAFSDYITNFTFSRGVRFEVPAENEAIIPSLLHRVWNRDNDRNQLLWAMGQTGGVTGDCFVKIAYEDPYVDPANRLHPGKIRLVVLNPTHCFPEWHPHDRSRLIRFKLKYRFWGLGEDGTKRMHTYVELMTDDVIEEYIDDEPFGEPRPNPVGQIPVVHIANVPIEGSPWGMSDIQDIIPLNREYNEKATDVSDIVNYHAAPVTVITGAKASNLEKGPNKVWGGLPADASVQNLEASQVGANAAMQWLDHIKRSMHEITGVPEGALGQKQPISNTSGVALAIEYQPLMNRHRLKSMQYGAGIEKINELALLTLAVKEPEQFQYNPQRTSELKPGQLPVLDPSDPNTYESECEFFPPLPTDVLVKLNEIQAKMELGLESKRGALRDLGEEFPDEKMAEIFEELREDIVEQGALDFLRNQIGVTIQSTLGISGEEGEEGSQEEGSQESGEGEVSSAGGADVTEAGEGSPMPGLAVPFDPEELQRHLVTMAHGTKLAQRRTPTPPKTR